MRRREFLGVLGGAAASWPLAAHSQQPGMPVIGFLNIGSPETWANYLAGFKQGLGQRFSNNFSFKTWRHLQFFSNGTKVHCRPAIVG